MKEHWESIGEFSTHLGVEYGTAACCFLCQFGLRTATEAEGRPAKDTQWEGRAPAGAGIVGAGPSPVCGRLQSAAVVQGPPCRLAVRGPLRPGGAVRDVHGTRRTSRQAPRQ